MSSEDKIHREIITEAIHDTEKRKKSLLYKWFFIILSLSAVFTLLIAFLGGGTGIQYIQGRLASDTISDSYSITLDDGKIIVLNAEVYDELIELLTLENKEFKTCLIGEKNDKIYKITSLYVPKIYDNSYKSVTSAPCSKDTLIPLHSHPIDHCVFSDQDIRSYERFKEINPDALLGLMCSLDRFSFYS